MTRITAVTAIALLLSLSLRADTGINVQAYGAVGDGVTDDSAAIAAANAAAGGGTLIFPPGVYRVTSGFQTIGRVTGTGPTSIIAVAADIVAIQLNADRSQVRDLAFRADVTTTQPAIEVIGYKAFWRIENVSVFNNGVTRFGVGVRVTAGLSGVLDNVRVSDPVTYGIHLTGVPGQTPPNAIRIYSPSIRSPGTAAIFAEGAESGPTIIAPVVETYPVGIHLKGTSRSMVVSGHYEGSAGSTGLVVENATSTTILSGLFSGVTPAKDIHIIGGSSTTLLGYVASSGALQPVTIDAGALRTSIVGGQVLAANLFDAGSGTTVINSSIGLQIAGGTPTAKRTAGATVVADGGAVTHGLGSTPTRVHATPSVSGEFVSVTAIDSTTFRVAIRRHNGSAGSAQTIYWSAEK